MLELLGEAGERRPERRRRLMLRFETALAKASLDRVSRRDPESHLPQADASSELAALTPDFDWQKYFAGLGTPAFSDLDVAVAGFLQIAELHPRQTRPRTIIKTYLRWQLVNAEAALLPEPFVDEDFHFYRQILSGAKEQAAALETLRRRPSTTIWASRSGAKFVDQTFGAEGKARTLKMVQEIEKALGDDIQTLSWMTPATKEQALVKLQAVANKIGYPDHWRDYSAVKIVRGDAVGNDERATEFEVRRRLDKIGKPVDRIRVAHDSAHRQRLLFAAREQHQFPGRHSAAAFLRQPAWTPR